MVLSLLLVFLISSSLCASLPPPAAGPVLRGGAFVVVWNMPTAKCQKRYDVQLDLEDFGIVENPKQHFQGEVGDRFSSVNISVVFSSRMLKTKTSVMFL